MMKKKNSVSAMQKSYSLPNANAASIKSESSYKKDFPIFNDQPNLIYLDSAATALKPKVVIDAMDEYYLGYSANVHRGLYDLSTRATEAYENARKIVADFIHAKSEKEIVFTRGTTEAINIVAQSFGERLNAGDEIILSVLEHHSNIVPWQMIARKKKCTIKYIELDKNGELKIDTLSSLMTRRTKIIALSHVSNALGTITNLKPIVQKAHAINAKILIDAAQSAPHMPIDVTHLDCDFLVFSGHKMYGPTGIGVLYAKEKILHELEPVFGGGDMILEVHKNNATWNEVPWKFEAGTPPIAEAIGLAAAINYLKKIGMSTVRDHEKKLLTFALDALKKITDVVLYGPSNPDIQSGIISFGIKGVHPHDIADILNSEGIAVRAGHHCCMPLMEALGVPGTARISLGIYTDQDDITKLIAALAKVKKVFAN